MARFRSRLVVRSNKETVDSIAFSVAGGTTTTITLASAINTYAGTVGTCPIGSKIKAIWVELTYGAETNTTTRTDWYLAKKPTNVVLPTPGATGGNVARKFIFMERKGIASTLFDGTNSAGGTPPRVAGWIRVPRRFQNMAEGDVFQLLIGSSAIYSVCTKIIYKWYA